MGNYTKYNEKCLFAAEAIQFFKKNPVGKYLRLTAPRCTGYQTPANF